MPTVIIGFYLPPFSCSVFCLPFFLESPPPPYSRYPMDFLKPPGELQFVDLFIYNVLPEKYCLKCALLFAMLYLFKFNTEIHWVYSQFFPTCKSQKHFKSTLREVLQSYFLLWPQDKSCNDTQEMKRRLIFTGVVCVCVYVCEWEKERDGNPLWNVVIYDGLSVARLAASTQ